MKSKQGQRGVPITEMPRHACWGCWQAEAWPPSRVSGSCPPIRESSHWCGPEKSTDEDEPFRAATPVFPQPGNMQVTLRRCPSWQPWKHEPTANSKEDCLRDLDGHPFLSERPGLWQGPDVWCSDCQKASLGAHHLSCHGATVVKTKRGKVVSTLEMWQADVNLQRKQYFIPLMTEGWQLRSCPHPRARELPGQGKRSTTHVLLFKSQSRGPRRDHH